MVSGTCPCLAYVGCDQLKLRGSRVAAPKGLMTYAQIQTFKLKFQPCHPNPSLEALIPVLGLQGWDLGPKTGIWASGLGFEPQGWDWGFEAGI